MYFLYEQAYGENVMSDEQMMNYTGYDDNIWSGDSFWFESVSQE